MRRFVGILFVAIMAAACVNDIATSQNYFPNPIEKGLRVGIKDFATIPGVPARMTQMTQDSSGRYFVGDQRGDIYHIGANGPPISYIDIDDFAGVDLISSGERGFQSFAFHPDFHQSGADGFGKLYTIHSSSNQTPAADFTLGAGNSFHSVLLEWTTSDPSASSFAAGGNSAPREVLRFAQPFANHNAGQIAFNTSANPGTDRTNLYIGLGDGGSGGDPLGAGQSLATPFGALLRIDPLGSNGVNGEYGFVAENVFSADGNPNTRDEIYSYGLRNPQRFGWDENGDLYIADIGQNAVEEIDLAVNGGNFGWNAREGSFSFNGGTLDAGMLDPVFEYDHTNLVDDLPTNIGNRAVTVGEVVRGSSIAGLNGKLILGDFPTGLIFYGDVDEDPLNGGQDGLSQLVLVDEQGQEVHLLELINSVRQAQGLGNMSRADLRFSFGIDGEVFILNKQDGTIRQLIAVPEPTGLLLITLGCLPFALRRKKRL